MKSNIRIIRNPLQTYLYDVVQISKKGVQSSQPVQYIKEAVSFEVASGIVESLAPSN